jgi:hypothetical protein
VGLVSSICVGTGAGVDPGLLGFLLRLGWLFWAARTGDDNPLGFVIGIGMMTIFRPEFFLFI